MVVAGQPVRKIQDQPWQEPSLGHPKQEAHDSKAGGAGDEGSGRRQQAPGDHDAGNPQPSADFLHDDVAGHLEDEIAPEEDAGGETEFCGAHVQVTAHGQGGETDVDTVDVGQQVGQDRDRQQAPVDLPDSGFLNVCIQSRGPLSSAAWPGSFPGALGGFVSQAGLRAPSAFVKTDLSGRMSCRGRDVYRFAVWDLGGRGHLDTPRRLFEHVLLQRLRHRHRG